MYYVGIDLGGTKIAAGVLNEKWEILKKDSVPTGNERHYTEIIRDMAMLVLNLLKEIDLKVEDIKSIGVGSPGSCDRKRGILLYTNNIQFDNVPMRQEIQKYIPLPVYLDNDANCAALAESMIGAAKDVADSVTVTLGTGVGGGIILNNHIVNGFNGIGGEIGHMVIQMDGERCTCGRKGCWEAYASATGLIRQTKRAALDHPDSEINRLIQGDLNRIDAKTAFDAMRSGDSTGTEVVERYIRYVAEGVTNMINILQPAKVVIGGGISKEGETLLKPLREIVSHSTYYWHGKIPQTNIVKAEMGNDAGIVGAAGLGEF